MDSKAKKRYVISLFILVVGIFSLIISNSYALLKGQSFSSKEQVIKTGSVEISLLENFKNINLNLIPINDTEALLNDSYYEFSITNIGDIKANYTVYLENKPNAGFTGNLISNDNIKVFVEINNKKKGPYSLSKVNSVLDKNVIYKNEIINYKMKIWLDNSFQNYQKDSKAFLKLRVKAEQNS